MLRVRQTTNFLAIRFGLVVLLLVTAALGISAEETGRNGSAVNTELSSRAAWRSFQRIDSENENRIVQQASQSLKIETTVPKTPAPMPTPAPNVQEQKNDTGLTSGEIATSRDRIGEGDQLLITVFGQPDLAADVLVGESGVVTLSLVGAVAVKGKTSSEVAALFAERLQQGQYVLNPKVSVKVQQQLSRSISVLGEVQRPGRYPMQGKVTVLDALSLAGGLTARADRGVNIVHRAGQINETVEYVPLRIDSEARIASDKLSQELIASDVIFVPQQKNFYVYGEVQKPGEYPIEDDLTVMRVLSIGGGVTPRGSVQRIKIFRKSEGGQLKEIPVGITDSVLPGDVVFVNERIF